MCGWKCCISTKSIHSSLPSWRDRFFNSRISAKNFKTEGLGGNKIRIYETYKNTVMPHGNHIYAKAYDMAKVTMCAYSQSDHLLPHCKFTLRCCSKCTSINIPGQETDDHYPNISPPIFFHIYHLMARCTKHGRLPLTDKKICCKYKQGADSRHSTKIYTRKELLMI